MFVCLFIALGPADYIEPYQDHSPPPVCMAQN